MARELFEALPREYRREPGLGLVSGEDGLDIVLRMLAQAPDYLSGDGLLMVEVGASEPALTALLPEVPFEWIEFESGASGVFVLERHELVEHSEAIGRLAASRGRQAGSGE